MTGLGPGLTRSLLVRPGDRIRDVALRDRKGKSILDLCAQGSISVPYGSYAPSVGET